MLFVQRGQYAEGRRMTAVELAVETTKQLLTFSTAIIAVSFAFAKDMASHFPASKPQIWRAVVFHSVSVACGVYVLMAVTGATAAANPGDTVAIYSNSSAYASMAQIAAFGVGIFYMARVVFHMTRP